MSVEEIWLIVLGLSLLTGILSGIPVMLVISGVPLLVALVASAFGAFDLSFLLAYPQRIFGIMNNSLLTAVPMFILMGILLEKSRIAERMLVNISQLLGGTRSMLAISVLFVSTLIAASTGIIGATIVMLGMIALPSLLNSGVSKRASSGLICAAGTLGQIIPPSIVLIFLGDQVSNAYIEAQREVGNFAPDPVTVSDLFAGALLPGLLLVTLYAIYIVVVISFSGKKSAKPVAVEPVRAVDSKLLLADLFWETVPTIILILTVLGSILIGVATATEAAVIGVAGTLLLTAANQPGTSLFTKKIMLATGIVAFAIVAMRMAGYSKIDFSTETLSLTLPVVVVIGLVTLLLAGTGVAIYNLFRVNVLYDALAGTVRITAMIFGIIMAASLLSLVFRGFEGDETVHRLLTGLPGGQWGMLIATMLVIFALGFILEFVEIVFIVIPVVGPIILQSDFHPVWFAILIALNLQTSFLTPPFGFALFYFRSVAPKSIVTKDIYLSIIPFVIIQIITIGIVVAFPELATWLPKYMFG